MRIALTENGAVEIVTGAASLGQGLETVIAQIGADALGAPLEAITVVHGQTDRIDFGLGAFASRATVMTGSATLIVGRELRAKLLDVAAGLLQASAADLEVADGRVRAANGTNVDFAGISRAAPGLAAEGWFDTDHMTYPYGIHAAIVRVDGETGAVAVERFVVAFDVGRAVNPLLIEGQIAGGAAQGIGGALYEAFVYDDAGQPLAASFVDYLVPTAAETPPIEALITEDAPSPINPLGIKGAGEGGTSAAGAAIASAVDAAIGRPGAIDRLPITPEALRQLLAGDDPN